MRELLRKETRPWRAFAAEHQPADEHGRRYQDRDRKIHEPRGGMRVHLIVVIRMRRRAGEFRMTDAEVRRIDVAAILAKERHEEHAAHVVRGDSGGDDRNGIHPRMTVFERTLNHEILTEEPRPEERDAGD